MAFLTPDHMVERLSLREGARVADIGSGSGAYLESLLRSVGDEGTVYAIDIHKELLDTTKESLLRKGFMNLDTIWADIEEGVYLDSYSLDAVVMSNVLFMIEDKKRALKEVKRIVIPNGLVLVVDWSKSHGGIGPHRDHVFSESKAEDLFISSGFSIVARLPAGDFHYAFLAKSL